MLMKILCKILTFGRHWWTYKSVPVTGHRCDHCKFVGISCRICGKIPGNQWEIYKKKFLRKPKGKYTAGK